MEILEEQLKELINAMKEKTNGRVVLNDKILESLHLAYPFNKYGYTLNELLANNIIDYKKHTEIMKSYLKRNANLYLYDIAPRTFGQTWGEEYLRKIIPELKKASIDYDPMYTGEYDLWYDGIRIEVKASRAVKNIPGKALSEKALKRSSDEYFKMNFQQLKPSCCDVFVWIGVWADKIEYWVLSNDEVRNNKHFSPQHRKENAEGKIFEGQIFVTKKNFGEFKKYHTEKYTDILNKIKEKSMLNK